MGKFMRRWIAAGLAAMMTVSALAGCGSGQKGSGGSGSDSAKDAAKGRYLEETVALPAGVKDVRDMVKLEDGTIRVAASDEEGSTAAWDLGEDGESWEKVWELPREWSPANKIYVEKLTLSPKGDGFLSLDEEQDEENPKIIWYHLDSEGKYAEIPVKNHDFIYFSDYTDDGELLVSVQGNPVNMVNTETGELTDRSSGKADFAFFGAAGETLYVIGYDEKILAYSLESGEPAEEDTALAEAVKKSGVSLSIQTLYTRPLVFCQGEDRMFFCTSAGLYAHVPGGSAVEQVIDGKLCSLGSPDVGIITVEAAEGDEFYVLGVDSEAPRLFHYTYDADVAAVPDVELRAYTLRENSELAQNITQYQNAHPEIYVNLEVGLSEGSEMTVSDALRTLSTKIMAGDGPDILVLDGLPMDAYIEKGLLEDVSDVAAGQGGLFENLISAMKRDGALYGIPMRFGLPLVETSADGQLDSIRDLESLADEAVRMRAEHPDIPVIMDYFSGVFLAGQLFEACSPAWTKADGTLDTKALEEFYAQLGRIFDKEGYKGGITWEDSGLSCDSYVGSIGAGILDLHNEKLQLNFGDIMMPFELAELCTTISDGKGDYGPLNAQAEKVFVPQYIAGVSSKSDKKEEAREFLAFLLGDEAQRAIQTGGLPVSEKALYAVCTGIEPSTVGAGRSDDPDSYLEMEVKKLNTEDIDRFVGYVREAATPSLANSIVRGAVLEQAEKCVAGEITPAEAADAVADQVNLYLAE